MKQKPMIQVTWVDISGWPGWTEWDDLDKCEPHEMRTLGFKIKETKEYLWLAPTLSIHEMGDLLCIPKGTILKVEKLQ